MNKQSYLDSNQLQSVCDHYLSLYDRDIEQIRDLVSEITIAVKNLTAVCEGESFIAFEQYIERTLTPWYQSILSADECDIRDIRILKSKATKTYDGNLIISSYEQANINRDKYNEKAANERTLAASFNTTVTKMLPNGTIVTEHISNPHEALAKTYQENADAYQKEMDMWYGEMMEFDAIEEQTANLFTDGLTIRKNAFGVDVHDIYMEQLEISKKFLQGFGPAALGVIDAIANLFKFVLPKEKDNDTDVTLTNPGWLVDNAGKYGMTEMEARYLEEYYPDLVNSLYGLSQTDHQGYIELTLKDMKTKLKDFYSYMMEEYGFSTDEFGNKTYDFAKIYESIENVESMSNFDYKILMAMLSEFGINIGDADKNGLKEYIFDYMKGEIYNTDGSLVDCPFDELTYEERALYVLYMEDLNPEYENKMSVIYDTFEKDGYDGWEVDINNIKFLVYTAEDPYQSLFFEHTDDMKICDLHYSKTSKFSPEDCGIYVNVSKMDEELLGAAAYTTFFHELAHLIDYNIVGDKHYFSSVTTIEGQTLKSVLEDEVRNRIKIEFDAVWEGFVRTQSSQPDFGTYYYQKELYEDRMRYREQVVDYIMNEVDIKSFGSPYIEDPVLKDLYNKVVKGINDDLTQYTSQTSGNNYASDIYGGFTGNTLSMGFGHPAITDQWKAEDSTTTRLYWLQIDDYTKIMDNGEGFIITLDNGLKFADNHNFLKDSKYFKSAACKVDESIIKSSGNVVYNSGSALEMFAEYFSANMTRDIEDNRCFEAYSKDSIEYVDKLVVEMTNY